MRYQLNKLLFVLIAGAASTAAYANWETAVAAFIADEVAADVVQEASTQEPAAEEVPAPLMPPPPPPFMSQPVMDDPSVAVGLFEGPIRVSVSQTRRFALPFPVSRVVVADDKIADFRVISPNEFYVLGRSVGRTNLIVWQRGGIAHSVTIDVGIDVQPLREAIRQTLPNEPNIDVGSAAASIILKGVATNSVSANTAVTLANATALRLNQQLEAASGERSRMQQGGEAVTSDAAKLDAAIAGSGLSQTPDRVVQVINLLGISSPQQVMLQVRIAEVSKSLTDRFGVQLNGLDVGGNLVWNIGSGFLGSGAGTAGLDYTSGSNRFGVNLDAEQRNGNIRILAEPNIVAMSGEEASFNVGGKILIPVTQDRNGITLEERDYGVGLKFRPVVLADGRINLKVAPEVSELSKEPLAYSNGGSSALLPRFTTSQVSTTVQLRNGQSLAIGGLLKNTSGTTVKRFPILGDIPILGSLFRSHDFAEDKTELVVVVRAVLVDGSETAPKLPTDEVTNPTRSDLWLHGKVQHGE
jgi:pilus assembly protein CpaC